MQASEAPYIYITVKNDIVDQMEDLIAHCERLQKTVGESSAPLVTTELKGRFDALNESFKLFVTKTMRNLSRFHQVARTNLLHKLDYAYSKTLVQDYQALQTNLNILHNSLYELFLASKNKFSNHSELGESYTPTIPESALASMRSAIAFAFAQLQINSQNLLSLNSPSSTAEPTILECSNLSTIERLPPDLHGLISGFLDTKDWRDLKSTSKTMQTIPLPNMSIMLEKKTHQQLLLLRTQLVKEGGIISRQDFAELFGRTPSRDDHEHDSADKDFDVLFSPSSSPLERHRAYIRISKTHDDPVWQARNHLYSGCYSRWRNNKFYIALDPTHMIKRLMFGDWALEDASLFPFLEMHFHQLHKQFPIIPTMRFVREIYVSAHGDDSDERTAQINLKLGKAVVLFFMDPEHPKRLIDLNCFCKNKSICLPMECIFAYAMSSKRAFLQTIQFVRQLDEEACKTFNRILIKANATVPTPSNQSKEQRPFLQPLSKLQVAAKISAKLILGISLYCMAAAKLILAIRPIPPMVPAMLLLVAIIAIFLGGLAKYVLHQHKRYSAKGRLQESLSKYKYKNNLWTTHHQKHTTSSLSRTSSAPVDHTPQKSRNTPYTTIQRTTHSLSP